MYGSWGKKRTGHKALGPSGPIAEVSRRRRIGIGIEIEIYFYTVPKSYSAKSTAQIKSIYILNKEHLDTFDMYQKNTTGAYILKFSRYFRASSTP
jgi:hypothetical protein